MDNTISWVAPLLLSEGGPDIIIPESLLESWTGYAGDDYEKACTLGDTSILSQIADSPVWVLGGTVGSTCVGNVKDGIIILRIITTPDRFKLPSKFSDVADGICVSKLVASAENDAMIMAAACVGENVYEGDAVGISYSSGSVLTALRITTKAGGEYLVYHLTLAKAHGGDLRHWIYQKAVSFEHKDGVF